MHYGYAAPRAYPFMTYRSHTDCGQGESGSIAGEQSNANGIAYPGITFL